MVVLDNVRQAFLKENFDMLLLQGPPLALEQKTYTLVHYEIYLAYGDHFLTASSLNSHLCMLFVDFFFGGSIM